jgi:hypothetical protein
MRKIKSRKTVMMESLIMVNSLLTVEVQTVNHATTVSMEFSNHLKVKLAPTVAENAAHALNVVTA